MIFMNEGKNLNIRFKKHYIPYIIFFGIFLLVSLRTTLQPGDDTVFRDAFRNYGGVRGWLKVYTETWSGRIVPHFLLILFLNRNIIFWRFANSIVFLLLAVSIYRISINSNDNYSDRKKTIIATIICGGILFIPSQVIYSGGIWITGSFTYLWPTVCVIFAMIPFKRLIVGESNNPIILILGTLCAVFSCYSEQTAAVLLVFSGLTIIYSLFTKSKAKIYHFILFVTIVINSYISLSAPGNKVRTTAETLMWYSDFDMLSGIDKVFLGVNLAFSHIFGQATLLMLGLSLVILVLVTKKTNDIFTNTIATLPVIFAVFNLIVNTKIFDIKTIDMVNVRSLHQYIYIFIGIFVCLIILYLFFIVFDKYQMAIIAGLLFAAGISSIIVLGFSPTMYASQNRIFFIPDILIFTSMLISINQYLSVEEKLNNTKKVLFISFIGISICMGIYYVTKIATTFML